MMGKSTKKVRTKPSASTKGKVPQLADLLGMAQHYIDTFDFESALQFALQALSNQPERVASLELCGFIYQELDMHTEAKYCFEKAVALSPEEGHVKYLYLAQLCQGVDAIQHFLKGIHLMQEQLTKSPTPDSSNLTTQTNQPTAQSSSSTDSDKHYFDEQATPSKVSTAFCSIAEIYMTDLKETDPEAMSKCQDALQKAIAADPKNGEALITCASFHMLREDKEEARKSLETSMELWMPKLNAHFLEDETKAEAEENIDIEEITGVSIAALFQCAKMLMSLEQNEKALELLEMLSDQEDEDLEIAYSTALAATTLDKSKEENVARCRAHLNDAMKLAKRYKEKEVVQELRSLLASCPPLAKMDPTVLEEEDEDEESDMEVDTAASSDPAGSL